MSIMATLISLLVWLVVIVGGIVLQVFLSRRANRWLGLILPAINLLYSFAMLLSVAVFDGMTGGKVFVLLVSTFLVSNVPTLVLLGIYLGCREMLKRKSQLDKMNIQDLG